jgi:hypothetical protein
MILDILPTHVDMSYSISLSGVTILKQSRYKMRHSGAADIVQTPGKGFQKLSTYKANHKEEYTKKKVRKRKSAVVKICSDRPKKVKGYMIDKKQVSHRIRNYVNTMRSEKLLYFWTVSFPKGTTDNAAYLLLNKWLTRLRQEKMLKEYLWVAERQQIGTIHFHLCINNKMDIKKANRFMRASIMYSIDKKEIEWTRTQAKNYNGVDIAKNRKTGRVTNFAKQKNEKSLSNYLTKYVTKNSGIFQRLAWHSSRGYSNLIIAVRLSKSELILSKFTSLLNTEKPLEGAYYLHYCWKLGPPGKLMHYLRHINQIIQKLLS